MGKGTFPSFFSHAREKIHPIRKPFYKKGLFTDGVLDGILLYGAISADQKLFAISARTSAAVGIEGAAPIRDTVMAEAALAIRNALAGASPP